jgi:hypothetical protein
VSIDEITEARGVLGEHLFPLFLAMETSDQRHGVDVYRELRRVACHDPEVLTVALLHDCGKASTAEDGRIRLWHRVLHVALGAVAPPLLGRLARRPGGLRLLSEHAGRGLTLAEAHGASEEVLWLMRAMEDRETKDRRARSLRNADDRA